MARLDGMRIAVLATDGFEEIELTVPARALRAEGARVEVVSLHPGRIRGMKLLYPGKKVRVDRTVEDADPDDYDALLVPGGFVNPDLLRQSTAALELVQAFHTQGKPIASLCHGPWVLASAGLVNGRRLTSWPGIRDDLLNAGAQWEDAPLVRDEAWVTSRGPHDLAEFVPGMLQLFEELGARDLGREPALPWRRWKRPALAAGLAVAAVGAGLTARRAAARA